jgi:hypothetical protein
MRPSTRGVLVPVLAILVGAVAPASARAQAGSSRASSGASRAKPHATAKGTQKAPTGTEREPGGGEKRAIGTVVPGFETLADGSTRFFVELAGPVQYDTKASGRVLAYVLKGAHVDRRNNYNPLVTVHFNTPVTSARLVPHGADLWFVMNLRSKVSPNVTMDATKEGGAMLRVEFPKGDYVPVVPAATQWDAPPPTPEEEDTPATEPLPPPSR